MTEIGSLVIRLEAQTAALRSDLAEARRVIDQHAGASSKAFAGMQAAARGVAVAVGTIGASLGVGAMVAFAKQVIETTGGLGEMADQLGVTTDGLQALEFQALQSGASAETLQAGIARLTRSIGDASEGNDALISRFRDLGVGLIDATGKLRPTEAVLGDVARGIAGIEDPAKQAAAVVDLFGKSGQKLLPVLRDLAAVGMEGVKRSARDAGAVVDEDVIKRFDELSDRAAVKMKVAVVAVAEALGAVAAAGQRADAAILGFFRRADRSPEDVLSRRFPTQLANPEAMRRALASRGASFDIGRFNELPPALSGPLPPIGAEAPRLPRSNRDLGNDMAADKLLEQLRLQRDGYGQLESSILRLRLERERDQQVVNGAIVDLGPKYTKAQIDAAVAIQKEIEAIQDRHRAMLEEGATRAAQAAERQREAAAAAEFRNRQALAAQQIRESVEAIRKETELVGKSTIVWNEHTRQFEAVNVALEEHLALRRMLAANPDLRMEDAENLAKEQVEAQRRLKTETERVTAEVQRQQATYDFLANMGERAFDRIGDAMVDMAVNGKDALSSLSNVARGVVASIYADFMKLAIANPIKNLIFGGNAPTLGDAGGLLGGILGGGRTPRAPIDAGPGSALWRVATNQGGVAGMGFARGGRPPVGKASWVGEEGIELFVPDVAGRIYPHDESMAMAGGGGDTYMIDARGADEAGMRRLEATIQRLNGSIEKRAVLAVGAAMNRGSFP